MSDLGHANRSLTLQEQATLDRAWKAASLKSAVSVASDMVERVAAAIEEEGSYVMPGENRRDVFLREARAAIAAMRNPNKPMIHAACKALSPGRRPTPERVSVKEKHRIRFSAMIDAALGKEPERDR